MGYTVVVSEVCKGKHEFDCLSSLNGKIFSTIKDFDRELLEVTGRQPIHFTTWVQETPYARYIHIVP